MEKSRNSQRKAGSGQRDLCRSSLVTKILLVVLYHKILPLMPDRLNDVIPSLFVIPSEARDLDPRFLVARRLLGMTGTRDPRNDRCPGPNGRDLLLTQVE